MMLALSIYRIMELKTWVEKNRVLTFVIFWGGLILIMYLLSSIRDNNPDFSARYKTCESLLGNERLKCEQQIDEYLEQEEEFNQQKINDSYRPD